MVSRGHEKISGRTTLCCPVGSGAADARRCKWFAAAKDAKLFEEAIALANQTPCDPKTLTRAARDFAATHPAFAVEAGLAALRWLVLGYGYEITSTDVWAAYTNTIKAASNAPAADEIRIRIRALIDSANARGGFVARIIGRDVGVP